MAVSWDPNWQDSSRSGAGDLTIVSPSLSTSTPGAGYDVAAVAVYGGTTDNGDGTITDPGDLTEYLSHYESAAGTLASRFYLLARVVSDDDLVVAVSHSAVGVAGFFPATSTPSWLDPHTSTAVPGEPGEVYANPQEINNTNALPPFTIPAWVPCPAGGIDAGLFFSATSGGSINAFALTSVEADTDLSQTQTVTSGTDRVRIGMFAVENSVDDPVELAANPGNAAERRWLAVVGFAPRGRWALGSTI